METLLFGGAIVLGLFLALVLFSLLSMAQRTDQINDCELRGEEIAGPAKPLYRTASKTSSPISKGKPQPQRSLSAPAAP